MIIYVFISGKPPLEHISTEAGIYTWEIITQGHIHCFR